MGPFCLEAKVLPVFPCLANKKPATPRGFKDATADPKIIDLLWRRYWGPLTGVPTGTRSGLAVLDIDTKHNGEAWLADFEATHGFARTRVHATRSGGLHLVFKHRPGLKCSAGLIAPGVDVRGDAGYVIWWPASGGRVLCEGPIAPWPASLDQALAEAEERRGRRIAEKPSDGTPMVWQPSQADYRVPRPLYLKVLES
jgi:hypothetical protein